MYHHETDLATLSGNGPMSSAEKVFSIIAVTASLGLVAFCAWAIHNTKTGAAIGKAFHEAAIGKDPEESTRIRLKDNIQEFLDFTTLRLYTELQQLRIIAIQNQVDEETSKGPILEELKTLLENYFDTDDRFYSLSPLNP